MKKDQHNIRVEAELWEKAMKKAASKGTTLSEEIRRFLVRYVRGAPDAADQ